MLQRLLDVLDADKLEFCRTAWGRLEDVLLGFQALWRLP